MWWRLRAERTPRGVRAMRRAVGLRSIHHGSVVDVLGAAADLRLRVVMTRVQAGAHIREEAAAVGNRRIIVADGHERRAVVIASQTYGRIVVGGRVGARLRV